jgi:hypothetical protein
VTIREQHSRKTNRCKELRLILSYLAKPLELVSKKGKGHENQPEPTLSRMARGWLALAHLTDPFAEIKVRVMFDWLCLLHSPSFRD